MKIIQIRIDEDGYPEWVEIPQLSIEELYRTKLLIEATINNRQTRIPDKNGHVCTSFVSMGDGISWCTECDRSLITDIKRFIKLVAEPLEIKGEKVNA